MIGVKPRAAQRYMDECASSCPHCEESDGLRRIPSEGRIRRHRVIPPSFDIPCYCARCAGGWTERYALVAVQIRPVEVTS